MTTYDVAAFVGSLRRESFNRKLTRAVIALAPPSLRIEIIEIGQLPLYNQDVQDAGPPPEWTAFRERVRAADAVLFSTPEYNRGISGALKNAIDVGSRPKPENAWNGRPGAVMSVSAGALGAFGAHHHLRQSLVTVNVPVMAMPEVYVGHAASLFDAAGTLTNEKTREFLATFVTAFAAWVETNR